MAAVNLPDVSLAYGVRGLGSDVTLLHGFAQSRESWRELADSIETRHRCLTPDLRGHGATRADAGAPHTVAACANDVVAMWDRLGTERSHLVGYSMGGRLALHMATEYSGRLLSLTVISAHAGLEDEERARRQTEDEDLARRIESLGIEWFAAHWGALPLFASLAQRRPDLAAALSERRLANDPAGLAASLRGMGAGAMLPFWDALPRVACPTLLIAGADDARYVAFAEQLGAALPDARVEIVRNAGHAVQVEQPAVVARLLADFHRDVDGAVERPL